MSTCSMTHQVPRPHCSSASTFTDRSPTQCLLTLSAALIVTLTLTLPLAPPHTHPCARPPHHLGPRSSPMSIARVSRCPAPRAAQHTLLGRAVAPKHARGHPNPTQNICTSPPPSPPPLLSSSPSPHLGGRRARRRSQCCARYATTPSPCLCASATSDVTWATSTCGSFLRRCCASSSTEAEAPSGRALIWPAGRRRRGGATASHGRHAHRWGELRG